MRSLIKSRKCWSLGFINETEVDNIESSGLGFFGEIVNPRLNQKVGARKVTMMGWWGSAGFQPRKGYLCMSSAKKEVGLKQEQDITIFYRFSKGSIGKFFNPGSH